jgi:hypothetical protein
LQINFVSFAAPLATLTMMEQRGTSDRHIAATLAMVFAMAQANAGQSSLANAYNLGAAIGWQRFVVSGDLANVDTGPLFGERKAADIGLSYAGKRWSTTVQLSADRSGVSNRFLGRDESVALDVGGSYRIATNIDVTGGVRYKMQRDRLDSTVDNRRDSQSVYVGTAFRF